MPEYLRNNFKNSESTTSLYKKDYISIMFVSDESEYKLMCL